VSFESIQIASKEAFGTDFNNLGIADNYPGYAKSRDPKVYGT
jgi:hypothetical protein